MMNENNIRKLIEDEKYIIVCDTNVYLHIYKWAPEFTNFALLCLRSIANNVIITPTINIEYDKHKTEYYRKMNSRINKAKDDVLMQLSRPKQKLLNACDVLSSLQYPNIEALKSQISSKFDEIYTIINGFLEDEDVMQKITDTWDGVDLVDETFKTILNNVTMIPFSEEELFNICSDGAKRYEQSIPPGFKDAKDKDGLRKYSDLIIWKEVINYVKEHDVNVIFVTDDLKSDWWENGKFHSKLVEEFNEETGKQIIGLSAVDFFTKVSEAYYIERTDAVDIYLNTTDDVYFENVSDEIFDSIIPDIIWSGESLLDSDSCNIGTEGIDEHDILEWEYKKSFFYQKDSSHFIYLLTYELTTEATSYDYWGRDDETKEVILSPGTNHKFNGEIVVEVKRRIDDILSGNPDFGDVRIISGDLTETEHNELMDDYYEDDFCKPSYGICSKCGKPIYDSNVL